MTVGKDETEKAAGGAAKFIQEDLLWVGKQNKVKVKSTVCSTAVQKRGRLF